ncbi:bromodomain-containing protein 2 [Microdochium nivale]|nr:bromodomain-containing protein 2 [Microdochium nivale]
MATNPAAMKPSCTLMIGPLAGSFLLPFPDPHLPPLLPHRCAATPGWDRGATQSISALELESKFTWHDLHSGERWEDRRRPVAPQVADAIALAATYEAIEKNARDMAERRVREKAEQKAREKAEREAREKAEEEARKKALEDAAKEEALEKARWMAEDRRQAEITARWKKEEFRRQARAARGPAVVRHGMFDDIPEEVSETSEKPSGPPVENPWDKDEAIRKETCGLPFENPWDKSEAIRKQTRGTPREPRGTLREPRETRTRPKVGFEEPKASVRDPKVRDTRKRTRVKAFVKRLLRKLCA